MKTEIELTGLYNVTKGPRDKSWHVSVAVDLEKVPVAMWPDLIRHGLKQKIADAASQSKTEDEAKGAMFKALDAIYAGEWSTRGAGEGLSDTRSVAIYRLYIALMDKETKKRFNKAFDSQSAKVRKALESEKEFTDAAIAAEIAVIETERAAAAAENERRATAVANLAGKIAFDF